MKDIVAWLDKYKIENYTINKDGTVDVNGDVKLGLKSLEEIPVKFNKVVGDFDCTLNYLTTLKGCPDIVGGNFDCSVNKLTSLEGCPNTVGGDFSCRYNKLTSLKGCPDKIGGDFDCTLNYLTTLKGCPDKIGGDIYIDTFKIKEIKLPVSWKKLLGDKETINGKDIKKLLNTPNSLRYIMGG